MRVTLSGERFEVTTKFYIPEEQWSVEAGKMKGNSEEAKRTNSLLDAMRVRAFDYQQCVPRRNRRLCNIIKKMTFQTARHTFATTVTLNNRVLLKPLAKCSGIRT